MRRDGSQDRLAGQLMTEGEPIASGPQQAPSDALIHFVEDRTGNSEQELRLERGADHRGEIEDRPRLGREPGRTGEDGVADRGRDCLILSGEDLGQEERIAPGESVQGGGVTPAVGCHALYRFLRQG